MTREEAIRDIEAWVEHDEKMEYADRLENIEIYKMAIEALKEKRPHGEWIKNDNGTYSCSVCQSWIPEEQHYYARYCLYCGAKMVERGLRAKMGLIDDAADEKLDLEYFKIGSTIYTQDDDKQGWTGREGK